MLMKVQYSKTLTHFSENEKQKGSWNSLGSMDFSKV